MFTSRIARTAAAACLFACAVADPRTCYFPDGSADTIDGFLPCNTADTSAVSTCCNAVNGDRCTPEGICLSGSNGYWRDMCTDQTWTDPLCITMCTDIRNPAMTRCADGTFCCGGANTTCCDDGLGTKLEATRAGTVALLISTSVPASTASTSATTTPALSTPSTTGTTTSAIVISTSITVITSLSSPALTSSTESSSASLSSSSPDFTSTGSSSTTSSTSSDTSSTGSSATSSSTSAEANTKSTSAKSSSNVAVAAGVGVAAGVLIIISAIAFFFWRKYTTLKKTRALESQGLDIPAYNDNASRKDQVLSDSSTERTPMSPITRYGSSRGMEDGSVMSRLATIGSELESPVKDRMGKGRKHSELSLDGAIHEMDQSSREGQYHELHGSSPYSSEKY